MIINLLTETIKKLQDNNQTENDVLWVGTDEWYTSWNEFKDIAKYFDYDDGFGGENVNSDLLIVGKDFWLERHEYDGSEWWEFKKLPIKSNKKKRLTKKNLEHHEWWDK